MHASYTETFTDNCRVHPQAESLGLAGAQPAEGPNMDRFVQQLTDQVCYGFLRTRPGASQQRSERQAGIGLLHRILPGLLQCPPPIAIASRQGLHLRGTLRDTGSDDYQWLHHKHHRGYDKLVCACLDGKRRWAPQRRPTPL